MAAAAARLLSTFPPAPEIKSPVLSLSRLFRGFPPQPQAGASAAWNQGGVRCQQRSVVAGVSIV
jgi:hypothetical protein